MRDPSLGPNTRAVHTDVPEAGRGQPLSVPIVQTSSFGFESVEAMEATISEPGTGYVYTRVQNPTIDAMERGVAELEGAEAAVGFASGMAAIHAALLAELSAGDHFIAPASFYGGAYALFTRLLPRLGIEHSLVRDTTPEGFRDALRPNTKVVYTETIGNPLLAIPDLEGLSKLAHGRGARVVVDSTLASPAVCRPLERGADVVIHSASKYLGGHGDLIAGVVAGDSPTMSRVRSVAIDAGGTISPFIAWLVLRGMKTLPLRMAQHQATALAVARYLAGHPQVVACHYPGLPTHPDHERAKVALHGGFGGVVAFEVEGGDEAGTRLANALSLFSRAGSLGDTHSLVVQPAMASHRVLSPKARQEAGIGPGFIRLSIGLEDAEDLVADLERAFDAL
ncbi:MAG: aminotransferase class I/II-fold pyridoxal phosphate-dependent enzyme [Myxococcota bacterium]